MEEEESTSGCRSGGDLLVDSSTAGALVRGFFRDGPIRDVCSEENLLKDVKLRTCCDKGMS